jgi:hypothetical protein
MASKGIRRNVLQIVFSSRDKRCHFNTLRFGGSASFSAAFRPAIIVSGYGQPSQPGRGFPRPETHHRERCDHRQMRRDAFERQHGFDPFADDCEIVANAETRAISENGARCCGAGTSRMGLVWRLSIRSASFLRINRHGKDDQDFSNSKNRGALEIFCHPIEKGQRDQGFSIAPQANLNRPYATDRCSVFWPFRFIERDGDRLSAPGR